MSDHPKDRQMTRYAVNSVFGEKGLRRLEQNQCPTCGKKIGKFKDDLSRREYSISGLCQECQDRTFTTSDGASES